MTGNSDIQKMIDGWKVAIPQLLSHEDKIDKLIGDFERMLLDVLTSNQSARNGCVISSSDIFDGAVDIIYSPGMLTYFHNRIMTMIMLAMKQYGIDEFVVARVAREDGGLDLQVHIL